MHRFWLVVLTVLTVSFSANGSVRTLRSLDWSNVETLALQEGEVLEKEWHVRKDWEGALCSAHYSYVVNVGGTLRDIRINLQDAGYLDVYADLRDISFRADGLYKSTRSLCQEVGGWLGATSPRGQAWIRVYFGEDITKDLDVRIQRTELDTMDLGWFVPGFLAEFTTDLFNDALNNVWGSHLGEVLSKAISSEIKKKIGGNGRLEK